MTEKELNQYQSIKCEIEDQEKRINELCDKELSTSHGTVKGSAKGFPYGEFRMGVWIHDPKETVARDVLIAKKEKRLQELRRLVLDIEEFIGSIQDSELRRIFELRFIDGKKQWEVAKDMNMDRSSVGKKIRKYLNFPPIPQNPML